MAHWSKVIHVKYLYLIKYTLKNKSCSCNVLGPDPSYICNISRRDAHSCYSVQQQKPILSEHFLSTHFAVTSWHVQLLPHIEFITKAYAYTLKSVKTLPLFLCSQNFSAEFLLPAVPKKQELPFP